MNTLFRLINTRGHRRALAKFGAILASLPLLLPGTGSQSYAIATTLSNPCAVASFSGPTNFGVGVTQFVAVGDFNGDSKLDLATEDSTNVSILLGDGTGSFGAATNFGVGTDPRSVAAGDFNGDSKLDLVTANFSSNNVSILLNICSPLVDATPPVVNVSFPPPNGLNGWFVTSPVIGSVTADDTTTGGGNITAISCTGATVGLIIGLGTPSASAPLTVSAEGVNNVSCTATDGAGNSGAAVGSNDTATVQIDTIAPTVSCSVSPDSLWPPNHKLVPVTASVTVEDPLSGPAGFTLALVTSSEPDNGLGDGDQPNDIQGFDLNTPDTSGQLRAERSGAGNGRIYTLTYQGTDTAGNASTCATTVTVPHDQGH